MAAPDDVRTLRVVHSIYRKFEQIPQSLIIALKLNDMELIRSDFDSCKDPYAVPLGANTLCRIMKKQLAYHLARQMVNIELEDEELNEILSNAKLTERFISLARELDVLEPKVPEDIYKSHLENTSKSGERVC